MKKASPRLSLIVTALSVLILSISCEHTATPTASNLEGEYRFVPITLDYYYIIEPESRWQAYDLKDYIVEQRRTCFCPFPSGFVTPVVKNNKIVQGIDQTNGNLVPEDLLQYYQTIDEVFTWIEQTQAMNPERFVIEYDARFGYPKKIALDHSSNVVDEELWIEMRSLRKIR